MTKSSPQDKVRTSLLSMLISFEDKLKIVCFGAVPFSILLCLIPTIGALITKGKSILILDFFGYVTLGMGILSIIILRYLKNVRENIDDWVN